MQIFKEISQLFFPNICLCCETVLTHHENTICTHCLYELPLTDFTLDHSTAVLKIFYGRVPLVHATALLHFYKKGIVQTLIHNLKYKGHQEIGTFLGSWLGNEMKISNDYTKIDFIIPVPLHKKRLKLRGYNQVTTFGVQLSNELDVPYIEDILIRRTASNTQTKKTRADRWKNVIELFYLTDTKIFENKHILLIDDIITTGATIESCVNELLKTKNIQISIAAMAIS